MEIKINGTVTINTESSKNQSEDKLSIQNAEQAAPQTTTQETTIPFDHSKDLLIDNSTTFNELLRLLAPKSKGNTSDFYTAILPLEKPNK